jgi:hypothetical protein
MCSEGRRNDWDVHSDVLDSMKYSGVIGWLGGV